MFTAWAMAFVWMTMFTCVTAGQVVLWGIRSLLPCRAEEQAIRIHLLKGTVFGLVVFLLCEAGMILAHLNGAISLEGIL